MEYQKLLNQPKQTVAKNKGFLKRLKKKRPNYVDQLFHKKHDEVFEEIDCLKCANCCKTTSPIFRDIDIKRIAKKQRMKVVDFIDFYLISKKFI